MNNSNLFLFGISAERIEMQNNLGQDKGEWKYGGLTAILAMLFVEREYSTPLSALFFKQYTSTQFDNRAFYFLSFLQIVKNHTYNI